MSETMDAAELVPAVETLLFASAEPLPLARLAELLDVPEDVARAALDELRRRMEGRALQVLRTAAGLCLGTRPEFAVYVARLREPPKERLSAAALEVLAVIAYRQPATKAEIDRVRGVDSGGSLHNLLEKRLVACVGRKKAPGRPMLYGTTDGFLSAFGLAALDELPELAGDLGTRVRQLRLEEQQEQAGEQEQAPEPSEETG
jgi:segregation and condensation protein B